MNIQSVCPNTKSGESKGTTFVVLNKDGGQMKISLAAKNPETLDSKDEQKNESENGQGSGKYFNEGGC